MGKQAMPLALAILRHIGLAFGVSVLHFLAVLVVPAFGVSNADSMQGQVAWFIVRVLLFPLGNTQSDGADGLQGGHLILLNSACWGIACALAHAAYCVNKSRSTRDPSTSAT